MASCTITELSPSQLKRKVLMSPWWIPKGKIVLNLSNYIHGWFYDHFIALKLEIMKRKKLYLTNVFLFSKTRTI